MGFSLWFREGGAVSQRIPLDDLSTVHEARCPHSCIDSAQDCQSSQDLQGCEYLIGEGYP